MLIEGGAKTNIFQQMSWILDSFGLSREENQGVAFQAEQAKRMLLKNETFWQSQIITYT